jgi:hypothetical protein
MGEPRQITEAQDTAAEAEPASVPVPSAVSFDSPKPREAHGGGFACASHEVLFSDAPADDACDVCGEHVDDDDDDAGHAVAGHGLYVWTRGEETRREEPPLCPSCAAALGLTALARWEIDEEEG